jgi:hypothetical protein
MKNEANALVPVSDEDLANEDAMLASLTDIAYSTAVPEPIKPVTVRKSQFFFRLSRSFADEVEAKKKVFVPKQMVHIDAEVERRLKSYKQQVPSELAYNIDQVREFFLQEIAPITMAVGAGTSQALEVVRRLVKSDVDGTQFEKFERMTALAVDIKMARFIARALGLTKVEATEILQAMKPRPPQIIPVGVPHERQERAKEVKKAADPS